MADEWGCGVWTETNSRHLSQSDDWVWTQQAPGKVGWFTRLLLATDNYQSQKHSKKPCWQTPTGPQTYTTRWLAKYTNCWKLYKLTGACFLNVFHAFLHKFFSCTSFVHQTECSSIQQKRLAFSWSKLWGLIGRLFSAGFVCVIF